METGDVDERLALAHQSVDDGVLVRMAQAHAGDQDLILRDLQMPEDRFLKQDPGRLRAGMQALARADLRLRMASSMSIPTLFPCEPPYSARRKVCSAYLR